MRVELADGDEEWSSRLVRAEADAAQRDRYRVVLVAGAGVGGVGQTRAAIAAAVSRGRQFVGEWVGRYRRRGPAGLTPRRAKWAEPTPTAAEPARFKALRGKDAKRLLEKESGKPVALSTAYKLPHDAGL